jgi:hypothetical protein
MAVLSLRPCCFYLGCVAAREGVYYTLVSAGPSVHDRILSRSSHVRLRSFETHSATIKIDTEPAGQIVERDGRIRQLQIANKYFQRLAGSSSRLACE